ncbi:MAG TPA: hypothetical protein VFJ02_20230 [Vicinamibacterales bacterium]|nr:hypothetical protein [Vicinamibacterales bacterium]
MKALLLVPAAALVALGGDGFYHALRSRERITIDCNDFARARPRSHRVLVTGCEIDYAAAGYREADGRIEELFLPARPVGRGVPAPLVIATRNPSALALAQTVAGGGKSSAPQQSVAVMEKAAAAAGATGAVDGLIRSGIVEQIKTRRVLSGLLGAAVAPEAVMIDLHENAGFGRPILALAAGLLLGAVALLPFRSRRSRAASIASTPDSTAAVLPHGHSSPSTVMLPRLLLLALDVTAGPDAIETAPPLGSRRDVIAILTGVIPDVHADATGRVLSRADSSIAVDLGAHDPVATAIVDARGEAGVALVKEILLMTGWRAFAPKTGLFVSANELAAIGALAADDRDRTAGTMPV